MEAQSEDGYVQRRHDPPDKQRQGGSWVYDEISQEYHMASSLVRGTTLTPSPANPSVYESMHKVQAAMAKHGMPFGGDIPPYLLEPNPVTDSMKYLKECRENLCRSCRVLLWEALLLLANVSAEELDLDIKSGLNDLRTSAVAGCKLCKFLLKAFEGISPYSLERFRIECNDQESPIQVIGNANGNRLKVWLRNPLHKDLDRRLMALELCILDPKSHNKEGFERFASEVGLKLPSDFLSDRTHDIIQHWLTDCLSSHANCPKTVGLPLLPSRVIKVGGLGETPRLISSNNQNAQYAALSYCWGRSWHFTTTLDTLEANTKCISLAELPPTLRHAVLITRNLGLEYIWIDSICIIQDSEKDWAEQSSKMAEIYQNCFVTLSASRAASSMEGILIEQLERQSPLQLDLTNNNVRLWIDIAPLEWEACVENDALNQRGWVLQERYLSPRTLFFSGQQVFWECRTKRASQHQFSSVIGKLHKAHDDIYRNVPERSTHFPVFKPEGQNAKQRNADWHQLIQNYTRRSHTKSSDKLPALAGLARALRIGDEQYIAGTWMSNLFNNLCWRSALLNRLRTPKDVPSRAPSWSWASLDGEIEFLELTSEDSSKAAINAEHIRITPTISDFMGTEKNVFLEIRGVSKWVRARNTTRKLETPSTYNDWCGTYDKVNENWSFRLDQATRQQPISCLRLILQINGDKCYSLLLEPANDDQSLWRRIGVGYALCSMVDIKMLDGERHNYVII